MRTYHRIIVASMGGALAACFAFALIGSTNTTATPIIVAQRVANVDPTTRDPNGGNSGNNGGKRGGQQDSGGSGGDRGNDKGKGGKGSADGSKGGKTGRA